MKSDLNWIVITASSDEQIQCLIAHESSLLRLQENSTEPYHEQD
jgi:hypothetical protein